MASVDLVKELYAYFREERLRHAREPNVYWVTDLVACSLKPRFAQEFPELDLARFFSPAAVLGVLVHKGVERLLSELLGSRGICVEVEPEASAELDLGAGRVVVRGRADMVIRLPDGSRLGVEVKSARSDAQLPLEHHVDQVSAYNTLFGLERSILLYVTPDRIAQFEVSRKMSLEEIGRRIAEPKAPRYPWECRYCPFSVVCPKKVSR